MVFATMANVSVMNASWVPTAQHALALLLGIATVMATAPMALAFVRRTMVARAAIRRSARTTAMVRESARTDPAFVLLVFPALIAALT